MATIRPYYWLTFLTFLLPSVATGASADTIPKGCPIVKVEVEQLPDLNIPRAGHQLFFANGEYVVAGGHTSGFVPTQTAEYYSDGEWHTLQMVYNHDTGYSLPLSNGLVLLGGGSSEPIGIGQTFLAELYDPATHTFDGFNSMECKRTWCSALELDSGRVVIAGNWYHDDGIEVFNSRQKRFIYIKDVAQGRVCPYIFRTAKDDAIIFGSCSTRGDSLRLTYADRLKGDTLHIPLFETWQPLMVGFHHNWASQTGDEQKGQYSYLLPVEDSTGQVAIARADGGRFELLPTACPVPMKSPWGGIYYTSPVIADRQNCRAYMLGIDANFRENPDKPFRLYVLCIDYDQVTADRPAPLTLGYTDPMTTVPEMPILTPDGDLLLAGGYLGLSNFTPSASVLLLHLRQQTAQAPATANRRWLLLALAGVVLLILVFYVVRRRQAHRGSDPAVRPASHEGLPPCEPCEPAETDEPATLSDADRQLMERIRQLMEHERLYTNSNLKVSDVAARLNTNSRYVSECIRRSEGTTFSGYVNRYRIDYAQRLMRTNPQKKVSTFYLEAGFANESTFFRTFKAIVGTTPKEWMEREHDTDE